MLENCILSENDDLAERYFLICASNFKARAKKSGRAGERRDNGTHCISRPLLCWRYCILSENDE